MNVVMKLGKVAAPLTRRLGVLGLKVSQKSPELCLIGGIACGITGTVLACKATLKADDILDRHNERKKKIKEAAKVAEEDGVEYNKNLDMAIAYKELIFDGIKLYGPAILFGIASVGLCCCSVGILKKRNLALLTAYTALDDNFKKYRTRAVDKFGEEIDRELSGGVKKEKVLVEEVDPETGEVTHEEKEVETLDKATMGDWTNLDRVFSSETTCHWQPDKYLNESFLKATQYHFTNLLQTRGYVFLDEVYKELGFPITGTSKIVGWIIDPADPKQKTKQVSLGLMPSVYEETGEHVYPTGRVVRAFSGLSYYLTFDVDGVIWNLVDDIYGSRQLTA